jgi:hypothetical protein
VGPDGIPRSPDKEHELNKIFNGVFTGSAGSEVLKYLRFITIEAVSGPNISSTELFHREGMRYLVGIIEQRISRGKNG